jgi:hypothetical protein
VNKLFPTQFDEESFQPNFKTVVVQIKKAKWITIFKIQSIIISTFTFLLLMDLIILKECYQYPF